MLAVWLPAQRQDSYPLSFYDMVQLCEAHARTTAELCSACLQGVGRKQRKAASLSPD